MAFLKNQSSTTSPEDSWGDLKKDDEGRPSDSLILPMVRGLRVLVIGDTPRRRQKLVAELREHGVKASSTAADEEGYRAALKFAPDVAISEMARPGDPSWWLFKRFHRHPLLRWTPTLLMKWWEEKDGAERILVKQIFERLMEALTPIRMLEERIAAGRRLNDRVELTGIQPVIRVFVNAQLTGSLSVNDSWNVFELEMVKGEPMSCSRRGVDGREDAGPDALLQLLTVDSGHWTFRVHDSAPRPRNLMLSFERLMESCHNRLLRVLGPDVNTTRPELAGCIRVDRAMFHEVAATLTGIGRDVLEGMAAGASEAEIDTLIGDQQDRVELEQAIVALVRCGGIRISDRKTGEPPEEERRDAVRVFHVLEWIARDHRLGATVRTEETGGVRRTKIQGGSGVYSYSNAGEEKVAGSRPDIRIPRVEGSETVDLAAAAPAVADPSADPVRDSGAGDPPGWRRTYAEDGELPKTAFLGVTPRESLAPGAVEDRSRLMMWVAIAIAVVLAGLLLVGLVLLASHDSPRNRDRVHAPAEVLHHS